MIRTYQTAPLPERDSLYGPVTTARLRRTGVIYGLLFAAALGLTLFSASAGSRAFGLGLMAPGAGFLYFAAGGWFSVLLHVGLFVLTWALFAGALLLWFGTGNVLAPPLVWLGAAAWAGSMDHHATLPAALWLVPATIGVGLAALWVYQGKRLDRAMRNRDRRQAIVEAMQAPLTPRFAATDLPEVHELSREDLGVMRFILDRSLQPIGSFKGYDMVEQFYFSAVRYALFSSSYALSLAQYSRMPAFRGYLSVAQRNLIEKARIRTIWKYWRWENAWGNLRLGADPMAPATHDNVMYTGWYAAMIAFYASNTGDHRYNEPGSLTLDESAGEQYVYDLPMVTRMLAEDMNRNPFCLIPCEPKWSYVVCNNFAGVALDTNDRLYGTDYWSTIEPRFRKAIDEEFMTLDGRLVTARSTRTGFAHPGTASTMADAGAAFYLHALLPNVARRLWAIIRADLLRIENDAIHVEMSLTDHYDKGNYKPSDATTFGIVAAAALEMGDYEVNEKLIQLIEERYPSILDADVRHHPGVSVIGHAWFLCAQASRMNAVLDMAKNGMPKEWSAGPVIERAEYPDVLVAKAVSDGQDLEAVLYPGGKGSRERIGIAQLEAGRRYRSLGTLEAEVTADERGQADVSFDLEDRTEIRLVPTGY